MMTRFSSWEADFWKKDYQSYKNGFGLVNQHWIGLENLHRITKAFQTNMRIDYSFQNGNTISIVYIEIKVETEENHYQFNYKSYDDRSCKFKFIMTLFGFAFQTTQIRYYSNNEKHAFIPFTGQMFKTKIQIKNSLMSSQLQYRKLSE